MTGKRGWLCRRARRRAAFKAALLTLPALFWSLTFMALAARVVERLPDGLQAAIALACPLLAVITGLATVSQGHDDEETGTLRSEEGGADCEYEREAGGGGRRDLSSAPFAR